MPGRATHRPRKALESGVGNGATALYRAVDGAELTSIGKDGFTPSPSGLEGKYFSSTVGGAAQYAQDSFAQTGTATTIVQTFAPASVIQQSYQGILDRTVPFVYVPNACLPQLMSTTALNYSPVPPLPPLPR